MASSQDFLNTNDHHNCPAELALDVIQGRWKVPILRVLAEGVRRFSELRRALQGVSPKVLTSKLRELERVGVVTRTIYNEIPPKVEYRLSSQGRSLIPILEGIHVWGQFQSDGREGLFPRSD